MNTNRQSTQRIREVRCTPVEVPLNFALGTSAAVVRAAPLLLVDILSEEGVTGSAYLFCYRRSGMRALIPLIEDAVAMIKGDAVAPRANAAKLERPLALMGVVGLARMALSAIDTALWDIVAKDAGKPLAVLLGASCKPIPAYNSCGLGLMGADAVVAEAFKLLDVQHGGLRGVKLRLGYASGSEDLAVMHALREALPADVSIMVDYNQALSVTEAIARGRALQDEGAYWLEEPIRHDDWAGYAQIAEALDLPVQLGENFDGAKDLVRALDAGACDFVMPDLARIGGVSGWMDAAAIAQSRNIKMSSHLFPEVSAHLLAATPTCHWLEYVDWADPLLAEPLRIVNGKVQASGRAGNGLIWDAAGVAKLRVE